MSTLIDIPLHHEKHFSEVEVAQANERIADLLLEKQAVLVAHYYTDENIQGRDILAAQMRSYWTQFAHTGEPGKGRSGTQPLWLPWGVSENNLMLLDSPSGGGLRMVDEPMTIAMLKERVAQDNNIPDLRERCSLYVEMFLLQNSGDDTWDEESYEAMGCGIYEPWSLESRG